MKLDKVGRLCLPEELANVAGIKQEAVLVGRLNKFEIWATDRLTKPTRAARPWPLPPLEFKPMNLMQYLSVGGALESPREKHFSRRIGNRKVSRPRLWRASQHEWNR